MGFVQDRLIVIRVQYFMQSMNTLCDLEWTEVHLFEMFKLILLAYA